MQATGENSKRWALLGATHGLGRAFYQTLKTQEPESSVYLFGRSKAEETLREQDQDFQVDFSDEGQWERICQFLGGRTHVVYLAGGGPFGDYISKPWEAHLWAFRVSFLFPAFLLKSLLVSTPPQQICFIGSSIAEERPDPRAASYAASKHALKGLLTSFHLESSVDVRLFSPGYMQTRMLPPNSWPRQQGLARDPQEVAEAMYAWLMRSAHDTGRHLQL